MRAFLFLATVLWLFTMPASAEEMDADAVEIIKTFPPELSYDGKPIDPDCIKALLVTPSGEPHPQELSACGPKSTAYRKEADPVPAGGLTTGDNDDIGYEYKCKGVDCGSFFYRYIGMAEGGIAISTDYTDKDERNFTTLDIIRREGDKIVSVGHLTGGERCNGGLAGAPQVNDAGKLIWGFNTTPYGFVSRYATGKARVTSAEMADCAACCLGRFAMEGHVVKEIDFQTSKGALAAMKRDAVQTCFNQEYAKVEGRTLTEKEAQDFVAAMMKVCKPQRR